MEKKKPDPSAFLLAAKKLDVEPQHCVVIEDAVNGIIAANRAGMFSIGILSSFSEKELTDAGATLLAKETYMIPELIQRLD